MGYVPRGPVAAPGRAEVDLLAARVRVAAGGAVAVRYEPGWPDGSAGVPASWRPAAGAQPRSTVVVDLRRTEDELLAKMRPKWRYNLGLAARREVVVREGGEPELPAFGKLMAVTARRDGFAARPGEYYAWAWRAFRPDSHLLVAERRGEMLAAVMVFHFGPTATYLYGASADTGRRDMPNHLLQWEALRRAKADGRDWYDLWGIPDAAGRAAAGDLTQRAAADAVTRDPLAGVWRFKQGIGGEVRRTVGAYDDVIAPRRYALLVAYERLRRRRA